jgi:hypothetical protein
MLVLTLSILVMVFILDAGQVYLIYIFESRLPRKKSCLVKFNSAVAKRRKLNNDKLM